MGIVFRQSVKTSIVIFTGAILGALTIWLSTKYIPKQQFGFMRNLTAQTVAFSNFLLLGTGHVLIVYIHRYANDEKKRKVLLTWCLIIPLIVTIVASIFYFLFPNWLINNAKPIDIPLIKKYFIWLPIYCLLSIYVIQLELYLGTQMKVAISAFMREVVVRTLNVVLILLFAFQYISFTILIAGTVLVTLFPILIFLILSAKTSAFSLSLHFENISKQDYKEIFSFSWYHFLFIISNVLLSSLDILMLPYYDTHGLSSVAVYGVAVYIISLVQLPSRGMQTASYTVLAQAITNNDMPKAKNIFERASINILIATVGIGLIICCNLNNGVAIISNNYSAIIPVFLILLAGRIVDVATGMNDMVLSITNYYKFNFFLSLFVVLLLFILVRTLIPIYGMTGAAWSTTITLIIFNIAKFLFVWKKLDMQPFSMGTIRVLLAALPALAAGYFFPYLFNPAHHVYVHSFIDAAVRSTLIVAIYLLMLLWLKPSPDLEEYLASVRKNKRLF